MKGKSAKILVTSIIALLLLSILPVSAWPPPTETHPGDSMWIEPSSIILDITNPVHTIGYKFNVTIYINITTDETFSYQIALLYNRIQLKATQAGLTGSPAFTSEFMQGHGTTVGGPTIDTSYLGNGSVLFVESLYGADKIDPPRCASLIWIEFEVLMVPPMAKS